MKFILTKELGRLARWLRILGYDTEYDIDGRMVSLIIRALRDERIIVTRNQRLSRHKGVRILHIKEEKVRHQIRELFDKLKVSPDLTRIFCRCVICNTVLNPVDKDTIKYRIPEYVFQTKEDFVMCPVCERVYWSGTHWGKVKALLRELGIV